MDHETFSIKWYPKEGSENGFCKTNRKPYDILVCFSLLAFKHSFNDYKVFHFSSNGNDEEWKPAKELFYGLSGIQVGQIFSEEAHLEIT